MQGQTRSGAQGAQVDEAAARRARLPGGFDRAPGLAHPARPGDGDDRESRVDRRDDLVDRRLPTDQVAAGQRQRGQHRRGPAGRPQPDRWLTGPAQPVVARLHVVVVQHPPLQLGELRSGGDADQLVQAAPGLGDRVEGGHRVAAQIVGTRQVQPEPLVGRFLHQQGPDRAERLRGDTEADLGGHALDPGAAHQSLQPLPAGSQPLEVAAGERLTAPQRQGLVQPAHPERVIGAGPRVRDQGLELQRVHPVGLEGQHVAGGARVAQVDAVHRHHAADPLHVPLQGLAGRAGRVVRPEQIDQAVAAHGTPGAQRQQTEDRDLHRPGQRDDPARAAHDHRAEHVDPLLPPAHRHRLMSCLSQPPPPRRDRPPPTSHRRPTTTRSH